MKTVVTTIHRLDGTIERTERPYDTNDYKAELEMIESEITPRRLRESVLTEEGRVWLEQREQAIEEIRREMRELEK